MSPIDVLPSLVELATRVGAALKERRQTVAVAESAAGGLISAALLSIPGASAYFLGGAVIYTRRAGRAMLGFTASELDGMRGETEPYAQLIASKIRDNLGATWGISESGAAGPNGSPYGDPPGHVCLAVVGTSTRVRTVKTAESDRAVNMDLFARHSLLMFEELLR
jgi:nicotinamide-nucleotide amidase